MEVTVPTTVKIRHSTNDKLAEVHDRLVAAIEDLVSGEDWRAFLEASQRLHTYSASNVLLIITQFPGATRVGGYRTWKGLGYQVRRGEKGIAVLAPIVTRRRRLDDHEEDDHEDNNQPEVVRILRGFRVVHVFDISQCDGPPWPEVAPTLLTGDAPSTLWDGLAAQVQAAGFTLRLGDCGASSRTCSTWPAATPALTTRNWSPSTSTTLSCARPGTFEPPATSRSTSPLSPLFRSTATPISSPAPWPTSPTTQPATPPAP